MPVGPLASIIFERFGRPAVPVPDHRHERAFGAQTANRTPCESPWASTTSPCGPSSSHSRRWVPSPNRWRSSSPIGRATVDIAAHSRWSEDAQRARTLGTTSVARRQQAGQAVRCARRACAHALVGLSAAATGGTAAHVDGLTAALATAGHDVVVLTIAERITDVDGRAVAADARPVVGPGAAHRGRPAVAAAGRHGGPHGVGEPCVHQARRTARTLLDRPTRQRRGGPTSCTVTTGVPDGPPTRWPRIYGVPFVLTMHGTERMRHGGQLPLGRPDRHQLDRVVARVPGRPADRADPVHGRAADHRIRTRRRPRRPHPQRRRPDATGARPADPAIAREPLVLSWGNVQYEKGFQVLARSMHLVRGRVPQHPRRDRRPRQLPARAAVPDRRRGRERHRRPARLRPRRRALRALAHRAGVRGHPVAVRAVRHRRPRGARRRRPADRRPHRWARRTARRHRRRRSRSSRATPTIWPGASPRCSPTTSSPPVSMSHGRALVEQTYAWDAIAGARPPPSTSGLLSSTRRAETGYPRGPMRPLHEFTVVSSLPPSLEPLVGLAANLHWAWDRQLIALFDRLDGTVERSVAGRPASIPSTSCAGPRRPAGRRWPTTTSSSTGSPPPTPAERLVDGSDAGSGPRSSARAVPAADGSPLDLVAYFSPEFGITEALPQYSGGLGVLAGDHLKASSDLGIPLVGVGLLYAEGYFHQHLNADGWQEETNLRIDPPALGAAADRRPGHVVDLAGVDVAGPGVARRRRAHPALPARHERARATRPRRSRSPTACTAATSSTGSRQEIVLGIGGVRALRALGLHPRCSTPTRATPDSSASSGSASGPSRACRSTRRSRRFAPAACSRPTPPCRPASTGSRANCSSSTSTTFADECGVTFDELFDLGQRDDEPDGKFNMAVMGLRLAARSNGVAKLHGDVSREMFGGMWPDLPPSTHRSATSPTACTPARGSATASTSCSPRPSARTGTSPAPTTGARVHHDRPLGDLGHPQRRPAGTRRDGPRPARPRPARSRRADDRLRPPLRHVQALDAAARASSTGSGAAARRRPAGAVRVRRQGPPGRPAGQGADPGDPPAGERGRRAAPVRVRSPTTTSGSPARCTTAATCG